MCLLRTGLLDQEVMISSSCFVRTSIFVRHTVCSCVSVLGFFQMLVSALFFNTSCIFPEPLTPEDNTHTTQ